MCRFRAWDPRKIGKQKKRILKDTSELGFPNFSPLDAGIAQFGPEFRILREISSSEPDSQVWNRILASKTSTLCLI